MPGRTRLARSVAVAAAAIAGAATVVAVAGSPGAAWADTTTTTTAAGGQSTTASAPRCTAATVAAARQLVEAALAARVARLNVLVGRVDAATKLAAPDRAALLADLTQTELPGIEALQGKVPSDTTCAELRADAHTMVFSYRVYVVMTPQTDLVIVADTAGAVATTMTGLEPAVSDRIAAAKAKGVDVSGAEAAFADYEAKVAAAQSALAGQSAALLALTPAGYPGNEPTIVAARTALRTARADLREARADLSTIRTDLS